MIYRVLADTVVVAHLLFIVFALLGGLLLLWRPVCIIIHLPAAIWVSLISAKGWVCPLTPLENYLRIKAGASGYGGGFIEHYIIALIYPVGLTPRLQLVLAFVAIVLNSFIYTLVYYLRWSGKMTR